jgi:hypothetical protein
MRFDDELRTTLNDLEIALNETEVIVTLNVEE